MLTFTSMVLRCVHVLPREECYFFPYPIPLSHSSVQSVHTTSSSSLLGQQPVESSEETDKPFGTTGLTFLVFLL